MARQGRALEQIVAALETALTSVPVEVQSPDYIRGKNSGSMREVDVSLRASVGSVEILVIVECRDRDSVQDVTWIEQIVGKADDVGASKAVAVSRSGFTHGAKNAAAANGIILRSVESVEPADTFSWLGIREASVVNRKIEIRKSDIEITGQGSLPRLLLPSGDQVSGPIPPFTPLLRRRDGQWLTIFEAWTGLPAEWREAGWADVSGSVRVVRNWHLTYPSFDRLEVNTAAGLMPVEKITLNSLVWNERQRHPISRLLRYTESGSTLGEYAEIDLHYEGQDLVLGLMHRDQQIAITLQGR